MFGVGGTGVERIVEDSGLGQENPLFSGPNTTLNSLTGFPHKNKMHTTYLILTHKHPDYVYSAIQFAMLCHIFPAMWKRSREPLLESLDYIILLQNASV